LEHQYDQLNQVVLEQSRQLVKMSALQQRLSQSVEAAELDRIKSTSSKTAALSVMHQCPSDRVRVFRG